MNEDKETEGKFDYKKIIFEVSLDDENFCEPFTHSYSLKRIDSENVEKACAGGVCTFDELKEKFVRYVNYLRISKRPNEEIEIDGVRYVRKR